MSVNFNNSNAPKNENVTTIPSPARCAMAAVVLIVFIRDYAERSADRAFDKLLAASALTIAGAVQVEERLCGGRL